MVMDSMTDQSLDLHQMQNLLVKGYGEQLLLCRSSPLNIRVSALILCRMYDEAIILLEKDQMSQPDNLAKLTFCLYMTNKNYKECYSKLEQYPQLKRNVTNWLRDKQPLSHSYSLKLQLRKRFEQLLSNSREEQYFRNGGMPIFLISCRWLQKMYDDDLVYIPAVDNSQIVSSMQWIQIQPCFMHYNYVLKQSCRKDKDYKIISFQCWEFLKNNFGGVQFRRFITKEKEPVCEIDYIKIRVMVVIDRYVVGFQVFQLAAAKYDTVESIMERMKKIMIAYNMVQSSSIQSSNWQAIIVSHISPQHLITLIQNNEHNLSTEMPRNGKASLSMQRVQKDQDMEDLNIGGGFNSDILLINIYEGEGDGSLVGFGKMPIKMRMKKVKRCLTCRRGEKIWECVCQQVYFCSQECRISNKGHKKLCQKFVNENKEINTLLCEYKVMMRSFNFDEYARGGRVGLENNVGYTCYMNAALQCVLGVEELNKYFCGNHHVKQLNISNVLGSRGTLACAYGQLVKDYYITNHKALQPSTILQIISNLNSQFRGYNHQDSQQFFSYFFDKLHEDLNRVREKPYVENIESDGRPDQVISQLSWQKYLQRNNSIISDYFGGQYRSQIKCQDCKKVSITFDPFLSVTLPFPKIESQVIKGYYLSDEGQFKLVQGVFNGKMNTDQFLQRYFHEPVMAVWMKNKQPYHCWQGKKTLAMNNKYQRILIFYQKPKNSNVQIQLKFKDYDFFQRKIFLKVLTNSSELMNALYKTIKFPILNMRESKSSKSSDQLTIEQYLERCHEYKFLQIVDEDQIQYPVREGIIRITVRIIMKNIPKQWNSQKILKFDYKSCQYEPKQKISTSRFLQDSITISQMIASFSESEELTENNAWYCNVCKDHKIAHKIMSIYRYPRYLILHLKRFNHNNNKYMIYGQIVKTPISLQKQQLINGHPYELFGVVCHIGSLSMGHYTAFVKRENTWYFADDQSFRKRQLDGREAYLLFYKRIQ